jgi:hypothetical protein
MVHRRCAMSLKSPQPSVYSEGIPSRSFASIRGHASCVARLSVKRSSFHFELKFLQKQSAVGGRTTPVETSPFRSPRFRRFDVRLQPLSSQPSTLSYSPGFAIPRFFAFSTRLSTYSLSALTRRLSDSSLTSQLPTLTSQPSATTSQLSAFHSALPATAS